MLSVFSGLSERQTVSEGETWKVNIGVNNRDGRTYKCVFTSLLFTPIELIEKGECACDMDIARALSEVVKQ